MKCQPETKFAVSCYVASTLLSLLGIAIGFLFMSEAPPSTLGSAVTELAHRWDSDWYLGIARDGYEYHVNGDGQNVAFFPLYPLLIRLASLTPGLSLEVSGLLVAHLALLLSFIVFSWYLAERFPGDVAIQRLSLVAFGVVPWGCFWRFAYSESTFLLLTIVAMYLLRCGRSLLWISAVVGLATAARPVGVALLVPLAIHIGSESQSARTAAWRLVKLAPLAVWGLLAYMLMQYIQFGEPLAFAITQGDWRLRPDVDLGQKLASLSALEPLWAVYVSDSQWYWNQLEPHSYPVLSLAFWNPVALCGAFVLAIVGHRKDWLTSEEVWLSVGLLLIPYATRSFDFCTLSQARFASVAFPVYISIAHVLRKTRLRFVFGIIAATLLVYFTARFSAGYRLI